MALSNDLVSAFAKLTDNKVEDTGTSVKGTFRTINGKEYVQLDGSEILTPVTTAVEAVADERVMVLIKDHMATVTENITSPAARSKSVQDLKDEVDEQGNTIQQMDNTIIQQENSIIQMNNAINQQGNTINQMDTKINQQGDTIVSLENTIVMQGNSISQMNNTIVQQGNSIVSMNNTIIEQGNNINSIDNVVKQQGNTISQQGNTISQQGNQIVQINNTVQEQGNSILAINNRVNIQGADIVILNSGFKIVDGVLTGLSQIVVDDLETNYLDATYADIDFANIEMAAVVKLFTESGIIKDLTVEDQHISGELVGVTLRGDLIIGNTIQADKLVVLGEDGIYYKLNVTGETIETQQTDENSLNGTVITAKTITASKITVSDLVAFGATIGGFEITTNSLFSVGKTSIDNPTQGVYLDKNGQFYLGENNNHVKYYKDLNGDWQLDLRANNIYIGTSNTRLGDTIQDIETAVGAVTDNLRDNYMTAQGTNDLVNNATVGLMNTFSRAGGNNLIQNSTLFFGLPNNYDYWFGNLKQTNNDNAASKKALLLQNGNVTQSISGFAAGDLSLRFAFKKVGVGLGAVFQYRINDVSYDVVANEGVVELSFVNMAGNTDLTFTTNMNDQFIVYDLMLNYGKDVFLPYQQAMNELKSTTVQISENIKVESNTSNTITILGTDGLVGYNKQTNNIVFKQTDSGLYTTFLQADEAEISDLMIKKVGRQVWITGK